MLNMVESWKMSGPTRELTFDCSWRSNRYRPKAIFRRIDQITEAIFTEWRRCQSPDAQRIERGPEATPKASPLNSNSCPEGVVNPLIR